VQSPVEMVGLDLELNQQHADRVRRLPFQKITTSSQRQRRLSDKKVLRVLLGPMTATLMV
jgi:hypothetical protein